MTSVKDRMKMFEKKSKETFEPQKMSNPQPTSTSGSVDKLRERFDNKAKLEEEKAVANSTDNKGQLLNGETAVKRDSVSNLKEKFEKQQLKSANSFKKTPETQSVQLEAPSKQGQEPKIATFSENSTEQISSTKENDIHTDSEDDEIEESEVVNPLSSGNTLEPNKDDEKKLTFEEKKNLAEKRNMSFSGPVGAQATSQPFGKLNKINQGSQTPKGMHSGFQLPGMGPPKKKPLTEAEIGKKQKEAMEDYNTILMKKPNIISSEKKKGTKILVDFDNDDF